MSHTCRLGLHHMLSSIHNVFHVSLLEPATDVPYPGQHPDPLPPVIIDDKLQWEVASILDSQRDCCICGGMHYLVSWKGFENTAEVETWEPYKNLVNALLALYDFHQLHPEKPKSTLLAP